MNKRAKHVIRKQEDPKRRWLWIAVAVVVVLSGAAGLYRFAQSQVECDWEMTQGLLRQQRELQEEMRSLRDQNQELVDQVVRTERGRQIDDAATAEMQATLQLQQAEIAEMKEQLAFFRGIVSPEESAAGLRIHRLAVWRGQEPGVYHFSLILIQSVRNEKKVSGKVRLSLHGVQDGKSKKLDLGGLLLNPKPELSYRFRYFQEINGALRLPKGFDAGKVDALISPSDDDDLSVRQSYDWQNVLKNSGD